MPLEDILRTSTNTVNFDIKTTFENELRFQRSGGPHGYAPNAINGLTCDSGL